MSRSEYVPIGKRYVFKKYIVSCWIEEPVESNFWVYVELHSGEIIKQPMGCQDRAEDLLDDVLGLDD